MTPFHESLRYQYDLKPESIVLDIGAYHGQFSKQLSDKYHCQIHAYEPVPRFFDIALETLKDYPNVQLNKCAVGAYDEPEIFLGVAGDSSGSFSASEERVSARQLSIRTVLSEVAPDSQVDLMKLNVEGAEFEILEHLLAFRLADKFRNIQVQAHNLFPSAPDKWRIIREELLTTHFLTYDAPWMWENYQIK
jgi:FkbM family methyltransferase